MACKRSQQRPTTQLDKDINKPTEEWRGGWGSAFSVYFSVSSCYSSYPFSSQLYKPNRAILFAEIPQCFQKHQMKLLPYEVVDPMSYCSLPTVFLILSPNFFYLQIIHVQMTWCLVLLEVSPLSCSYPSSLQNKRQEHG